MICLIQSVKISESIRLFVCALYICDKHFTFLKPLRALDFPVTTCGSFPSAALVTFISVNLTLLCLPPVHISPFNSRVLFGSFSKKKTNSSGLKIFYILYLDSIVGRYVSFQYAVISGLHDFFLLETVLNETLFYAFYLSTYPFDALKSSKCSY